MTNRFSVIIPVEEFKPDLPALKSLQFAGLDPAQDEVIVIEGSHPSHQRNEGVKASKGEILVFLDSDTEVPKDHFQKLEKWYAGNPRQIVGGPVLLRDEVSEMEKVFQAIFSNPWVMGRSAFRYKGDGVARETDQSELILCNMAMSRSVWTTVGSFDERLYPNEENEYMDRAEIMGGVRIVHDPALAVKRPQRESFGHLFKTFFRYGQGRGEQTIMTEKLSWIHHLPAFVVPGFLLVGFISWSFAYDLFSTAIGLYALAVFATLFWKDLSWQNAFLAAIMAPFLLINYGFGQWKGAWTGLKKKNMSLTEFQSEPVNIVQVPIETNL